MKTKATALAGALLELARAEEKLDSIDTDFRLITDTINEHLDLRDTLADNQVDLSQKIGVVRELFQDKVSELALSYLQLMIGLGRVDSVRSMMEELTRLIQVEERKVIAEVTTAVALDDAMITKLTGQLSKLTGKEVKIRPRLDESILGGILVRMDGKLLDGSVRSRLEEMKDQMIFGKISG